MCRLQWWESKILLKVETRGLSFLCVIEVGMYRRRSGREHDPCWIAMHSSSSINTARTSASSKYARENNHAKGTIRLRLQLLRRRQDPQHGRRGITMLVQSLQPFFSWQEDTVWCICFSQI